MPAKKVLHSLGETKIIYTVQLNFWVELPPKILYTTQIRKVLCVDLITRHTSLEKDKKTLFKPLNLDTNEK